MNLKEVKSYTEGLIKDYFNPKVLKKFDEDSSGNLTFDGEPISAKVSGKEGNAIQAINDTTIPSNSGLYVKDLKQDFIDRINLAQKTINESMYESLLDTPVKYTLADASSNAIAVGTNINKDIILNKSLNEFTLIRIKYAVGSNARKRIPQYTDIMVKDIIYNNSNTENAVNGTNFNVQYFVDNSGQQSAGGYHWTLKGWFKDDKTIRINTINNPAIENWNEFTIIDVLGINQERITIDPLDYVDTHKGLQDTPVGQIVSYMGTIAPAHYLICDGSEYNVADYPYLAQHFKDNFGSVNFFGGDGFTKFKVPDLSGEFLRGTGTNSHEYGGIGASVGMHQAPTRDSAVYLTSSNNFYTGAGKTPNRARDTDTVIKGTSGRFVSAQNAGTRDGEDIVTFTSRPTNTSVLYIIKYEPTYFTNIQGVTVEDDLLDTPIILSSNIDIILNEEITKYDKVELVYKTINTGKYVYLQTNTYNVKDIVYNDTGSFGEGSLILVVPVISPPNDVLTRVINFSDSKTIRICNDGNIIAGWGGIQLYAVRGIKTNGSLTPSVGGNCNCDTSTITNTDIEAAINSSLIELNK